MISLRNRCNVCGGSSLEELLDLGKHPLADTFLGASIKDIAEPRYPLKLSRCSNCTHIFTSFFIPPEERYVINDYSYDSSNSPVAEEHFKEFAGSAFAAYQTTHKGKSPSLTLDIGSNVGTLLGYVKELGSEVIGIEPSKNIAELAINNGINTICNLFTENLVSSGELKGNSVDLVLSTNVVNHIDDLAAMLKTVKLVGNSDLMFAFEVPYFKDLLEQCAFDTVYHEHVNYFTLVSVQNMLETNGFILKRVEKIEYMGGSIRVFSSLDNEDEKTDPRSFDLIEEEKNYFQENKLWKEEFQEQVLRIKLNLLNFVHHNVAQGKRICAIGAATKGNTLLNYCGLDRDSIAVCSDVSKLKVGKFMPGSRIPIIHDNELGDDWDFGLVLPWNLSHYLQEKFKSTGMELIFPLKF